MIAKIRIIALFLLSAAPLATFLGLLDIPPSANAQTEPEVTMPGMFSASGDNGGMRIVLTRIYRVHATACS